MPFEGVTALFGHIRTGIVGWIDNGGGDVAAEIDICEVFGTFVSSELPDDGFTMFDCLV